MPSSLDHRDRARATGGSGSSLDWIDGSTLFAGLPLRIWLMPW